MKINFDEWNERRNTNCGKWDTMDKKYQKEGMLHLGVADMDFRSPKQIIDAFQDILDKGIFGYTDLSDRFYENIRQWMKQKHQAEVAREEIVFCPRINVSSSICVETFTEEMDEVIINTPAYGPLYQAVVKNHRKVVESPLILENGSYKIDFEHLESVVTDKTKMFILCSPHNPVGRVWTREELERVAEICLKYNVTWMVDEMHCDFIFPGHTFTSCMNLDEKYRQILALYSSPGKTFNVAGLQPANIIIPNEELRKKYQWANTQAAYSQGSLMGQLAVKVCYTKGAEWVDELVQYIYENVQYMSKFVKENFPKAKMVEPEGTYLVWVDFSGYGFSNEELEHLMLEEAKLWLDSGIIFGPETAQFERFNVACPRVTVEQALTQLKDALDKHLAAK